jgi:site-specific DNA recombinase
MVGPRHQRYTSAVPTHAAKAGVRYRYYISSPHFDGNSKTAAVGSVSRIPAADIEEAVIKSLNEQSTTQQEIPSPAIIRPDYRSVILECVSRIDVQKDRLILRLHSEKNAGSDKTTDEQTLSIPWQKPVSRRWWQSQQFEALGLRAW